MNFVDYFLNQGAPAGHESADTPSGHESKPQSKFLLLVEIMKNQMERFIETSSS